MCVVIMVRFTVLHICLGQLNVCGYYGKFHGVTYLSLTVECAWLLWLGSRCYIFASDSSMCVIIMVRFTVLHICL